MSAAQTSVPEGLQGTSARATDRVANPVEIRNADPKVAENELRRCANDAMERYSHGDLAAFRELYRLTADRLYHYLYRRLGDATRAEEIRQQTFLHVHQARGRFTPGACVFPWMYAIAHRLAIDFARRGGREVPIEGDEGKRAEEPVYAEGAADELMIARDLQICIERALAKMPETQRAAYELIRQEGLSYKEAAEALGTTVAAVTSLLHRATEALHSAHQRQD